MVDEGNAQRYLSAEPASQSSGTAASGLMDARGNQRLQVVTYNIHKGFSPFHQHLIVHEVREQLRALGSDLVFLQEVQGRHNKYAERRDGWPDEPQYDFLAESVWSSTAYGSNVAYGHGHHGNAILSRFPIEHPHNQDVTQIRFERRGLLHCAVKVPGLQTAIHCVCAHLSIFARSRRRQLDALAGYLEDLVDPTCPLIIAGDFNDWRNEADLLLAKRLGLSEAFGGAWGEVESPGRSFPARHPVLKLDRIYVRGFTVERAEIHSGAPWSKLSDHAALSAHLRLNLTRASKN
jgi:endonuclease/exonuclease/phosphatase family metal-dependent hydrolase